MAHRILFLSAITAFFTSISAQDENEYACTALDNILASCRAATENFSLLPETARVGCLCYDSGTWAPDFYDSNYLSCANYVATASPDFFSSMTAAAGGFDPAPCRGFGDIGAAEASATTEAASEPTATGAGARPGMGPGATFDFGGTAAPTGTATAVGTGSNGGMTTSMTRATSTSNPNRAQTVTVTNDADHAKSHIAIKAVVMMLSMGVLVVAF